MWSDPLKKAKPVQLPAKKYIDELMRWIETLMDDPKIFPPTKKQKFPKNFDALCGKIFSRLFRVDAHIYLHHFQQIVALGLEADLNSHFKHLYWFCQEFKMLAKGDTEPLNDLIKKLKLWNIFFFH